MFHPVIYYKYFIENKTVSSFVSDICNISLCEVCRVDNRNVTLDGIKMEWFCIFNLYIFSYLFLRVNTTDVVVMIVATSEQI